MRVSRLGCCALVLALAGPLASCGGQTGQAPSLAGLPGGASPDRIHDLLYVANGDSTVSIYRYWQGALVGVLRGFSAPLADCADPAGNVYITDDERGRIYEYPQGATKPLKTLDDSPYKPQGCSVSDSNGSFAVANAGNVKGRANLAIYRHGARKPIHLYGSGRYESFTSCAYDDNGDLLALSQYRSGGSWYVQFYYLPEDGTKLLPMKLPGIESTSAYSVDGVAWDGEYWVAGPINNDLLLYSISATAHSEGTVALSPGDGILVGAISFYRLNLKSRASQVVGGTNTNIIDFFYYPRGAKQIGQIYKDVDNPSDVTVSLGT